MTQTRLVLLPERPGEPAPSLLLDADGRVLARAPVRTGEPAVPARTVLAVPGTAVAFHELEIAARTEAQASAAARALLDGRLAAAGGAQHVATAPASSPGRRSVLVADAARMTAWMDQAAALGLDPDVIVPDYALLPEPSEIDAPATAVNFGDRTAVRGAGRAFAVEDDLVETLLDGRETRRVTEDAPLERLLARGALTTPWNLRSGPYAKGVKPPVSWRDARLPAVLFALLLTTPLMFLGAETLRDRLAVGDTEAEVSALAAELAPRAAPGADPLAGLRDAAAAARRRSGFTPALAALFEGMKAVEGAELVALTYGGDGALRATVAHPNFADLETLRAAAARAGLQLREDATQTESGRVLTDVVLEPRP